MSELALHHSDADAHSTPKTSSGTSMGKVFMWIFLCQDALMFMGLFAAYLSVRMGIGDAWPSPNNHSAVEHYPLDINLTAINTFILICSSVTMVMAVQASHFKDTKGAFKWLLFTILGGSIFLGVQVYEYYHLIGGDGMGMDKSLFDATFFALTGFHGIHVFSGVAYLTAVAVATKLGHKQYQDVGIMEWIFRVVSVGLTIYFAINTLGLWKEGPWILKYLVVFPLAVGGSYFLPFIGPALFLWFVPFADFPPIPHVALSLVGGSIIFIMYRGIKWLRARHDMPEVIEVAGLYWHFVDLIWIILFTLVYLL